MQNIPARQEPAAIIEFVRNHPSNKIKIGVSDLDGILCGKYMHKEKFLSAAEGGFGFCDVIFGWDTHDLCYEGITYTGLQTGYPDLKGQIDLGTLRQVPWDNKVPFFLADFYDEAGEGLAICPRSLLKKVAAKAEAMGYRVMASQEFEFFNFEETPDSFDAKGYIRPKPITPGMFGYSIIRASRKSDYFNALFDELFKFDIPLEGLHTETGPGVYEAAILYSDLLEAGDRALLFKTAVKEIGMRHGITPSFMAKFDNTLPGSSGHIHQSVWDKDGKRNLFFDGSRPEKMSALMESYLAGQLYCLPDILPFYAPNINSYKRLVEGAWAPTTLTWGIDNRTTAIRALPGSEKSTRIEMRVPGADMNPYLAMAASVASGLYGIEKNLKLEAPKTNGNGYRQETQGVLSRTLDEANKKMRSSDIAITLFGEGFVKHFTETRDWEWRQFLKGITDWELKRYFEII